MKLCVGTCTMVLRVVAVGLLSTPAFEAEIHIRSLPDAAVGITLAHVAVMCGIDQVAGERPRVAASDALGIVCVFVARRLAGKQRYIKLAVVLQVAAYENAVAIRNYIIDLGNVGIQHRGIGGRPGEGAGVQSVAPRRIHWPSDTAPTFAGRRDPRLGPTGRCRFHGSSDPWWQSGPASGLRSLRRWCRRHCPRRTRRWARCLSPAGFLPCAGFRSLRK